ncbi:SusC/RagA family TonB-linked outer membrane protein [Pedobacter immunditicola]|uniref:SusC/RagA family TonB-linked outer membrane protein n=1 Tax=Pedobacter immunditicola TaxID=3133440 RepID=UPI0030AAA76D
MKKIYMLLALFQCCWFCALGQNITVNGIIVDQTNGPIPAVSIKVSGTNQGTISGPDGKYTISAPSNAKIVFSSLGFVSQTLDVNGRTTINVTLQSDATTLEGVVVTALGIERSKKSLTYSTTTVSADDLNQVKGASVLNSLAGKAAGVFVTQGSGGPGSSPRIVLRGNKSISGNNQPLYVVDGIPVGGFADYNPEDIENLQVLQGASAAALYGSQAANGVILITTKKGKMGAPEILLSSTATFDNPIALPEIQTEYGNGIGGVAATTPVNDSWGPKISNGSDSYIRDFFRTGQNYLNSLSISSGNEMQRIYFSYANTTSKGMLQDYGFNRNNLTLRGSTKLFKDKVVLEGGINYIQSNMKNRNESSWYNSPMFGLYLFPMGVDIAPYAANGGSVYSELRGFDVQNWPYIKNEHSSNQNPYWILNNIRRDELRDRTNINVSAKYNILDWLNVTARTTVNRYNYDHDQRYGASGDPTSIGVNGSYRKEVSTGQDIYTDVLLSANKDLSTDLTLNATAGFSNTINTDRGVLNGTNGADNTLYYANYFALQGLTGNFISESDNTKRITRAVLGTATLGYKDRLFLDVTGRNEWSSTTDDPFFYPSAGLAYVLVNESKANGLLSFAKIRGSYAEVGNALPFGAAARNSNYTVNPDESVNGRVTLPFFSGTDTLNLKPERTKSYEIGAEMRFLNDKLNFNVTLYDATTRDQVFTITAPTGAGATNFYINGGTIQNRGVEASLSYNAKIGNVSWSPGVNFTLNKNRIKSLSDLLTSDRFVLQSGNRLTNLFLLRPGSELLNGRKYGSYMDLFGKTYQYNEDGSQKFDATTGLPVLSTQTDQYIGNANPDFLLNFSNNFSYKNFSLSFLIDGRFGGLVSSSTQQWLDYKGLSPRTADARNNGGVMVNGKLIDAETYYGFISAKADAGAVATEYSYSSTNVRLRELAIGYTIPKLGNTIKNVNISLVGRNLFFFHKKAPFDPEMALSTENSGQGFESFQLPSAASLGATVRVNF